MIVLCFARLQKSYKKNRRTASNVTENRCAGSNFFRKKDPKRNAAKRIFNKGIPCLPFLQVDFFQRINRLLLWQGSVISRITQRKITWHNVAFRRTDLAGCKLLFFSRGNPDCTSKPFCRCSQQNVFNTAPHSGKPIQRLKSAWPQQIAILFIKRQNEAAALR